MDNNGQCRLISCTKCPTPVWDVDMGGYVCVGQGIEGKPLYLPLNFVVNLNCSENKVYYK